MQARALAYMPIAGGNTIRKGIEIQSVAHESLTLKLLKSWMLGGDAAREKIPELIVAQEEPIAGIIGYQYLARHPTPAEEAQLIFCEL